MNNKKSKKILVKFLLALVLLLLVSAPVSVAQDIRQKPQAEQNGFRFIVLSDTNPSFDKEVLNPRFPKALEGIPQHNPVFVIHAGDMVGGGGGTSGTGHIDRMWTPFFDAIKAVTAANMPFIPAPGNHDTGYKNNEMKEGYQRNWLRHYPSPPHNAQGNYPFYYSFDYMNNQFIILDSSNVMLGSAQIQWLSQDLANAKNKGNIFVVLHVPFMASGLGHASEADRSALEMIANAGANIIFAGHNHVYTEHDYGNARQITVGTAADDLRGRDGSKLDDHMFLVVDVLGKDNVKLYPASMGSGFKNTLDGQPIPAAPAGAAPSFSSSSMFGSECVPGISDLSSLISGDGISYSKEPLAGGFMHSITIDPNKYDVKVVSAQKAAGKSTATMAEIFSNTPGAVAAINAGFFEIGGVPTKTVVEDGVLTEGAKGDGSYTFILENGKHDIIRSSELLLYGPEKIKDSVSSAIGGLSLVFNGNNVASSSEDKAPRSGICITRDGAIKLLAVQGAPEGSSIKGGSISIEEFGQEAINKHNALSCVNLDGGGSTSVELHVNGQDVSLKGERNAGGCGSRGFPCQRAVRDALVVVPKQVVNPQGVAVAQTTSSVISPISATGAVTGIDSITGFAAADSTTPQTTPAQQINCICEPATQNTIVSVSSSGNNYDFSQIEPKYSDFGAKKDLSKLGKFENYIMQASQHFGVPVEFIKGIIMVESDGKTLPDSILRGGQLCDSSGKCLCNSAGYCGLMQTGKLSAKCDPSYGCDWENFKKGDAGAKDQIFSGANYIKKLMTSYNLAPETSPDYFYWIAAGYNGGPGSAQYIREVAAQRLGKPKEQVKWDDVTIEDAEKNQQKHFPSLSGKTEEIFYYPSKTMSVVQAASSGSRQSVQPVMGQICAYGNVFEYISIGKYYINPSFAAEIDYDLNQYDIVSGMIKGIISRCQEEDSYALKECIRNAAKDLGDNAALKLYNGPCSYAENMFSDFVEWTNACLESESSDCVCEIPLEYEYEKENTEEEIIITASGSGTIQISSANAGIMPQSVSGSASESRTIKTKSSMEMHYAKKTGKTLTFSDKITGNKCKVSKRTYKFCAETKKLYMVYDEKEKKLTLKPVQYKFAVEFPEKIEETEEKQGQEKTGQEGSKTGTDTEQMPAESAP